MFLKTGNFDFSLPYIKRITHKIMKFSRFWIFETDRQNINDPFLYENQVMRL